MRGISARGSGRVITTTFGYDGGRQVSAFIPATMPEAVVFAGDGQLVTGWGADLDRPDLPAVLVVGVHRSVDEEIRLHEYSPAFDAQRFAAHADFLLGDVVPWASSRFGVTLSPARTAAFGVSAGAELALALGLHHPQLFGCVLAASPGAGFRPPDGLPGSLPRTYLVAGTEEPFFLDNATRWASALRDAGADVVLAERAGTHGDPFWREAFPLMVAWAFTR